MSTELDRYVEAEKKVERQKAAKKESLLNTKSETEYALIHLKEHLNWYRSEVNHIESSKRNKNITDRISKLFPNADEQSISNFLSRHLVLTLGQFAVFTFSILFLFGSLTMTQYEKADLIDCSFGGFIFGLVGTFILSAMYDCGSFIRLYFIKDIIKEKSKTHGL